MFRSFVVRPPVVAFTALASSNTIRARAVVKYAHVVTNLGRAYQPRTGIFTVPYRGLYSVSCSLMSNPYNEVHLDLVKNGKRISSIYAASHTYPQSSQTMYLFLRRGDRVWMQSNDNHKTKLYGGKYNVFSGALISML